MFIFERGTVNTLEIQSGKSETFSFNLFRFRESVSWDTQKTKSNIRRSKKINCMSVGKGALDAIWSQINKKFGDRFHFQ